MKEAIPNCSLLHIAGHSGPVGTDSLEAGFQLVDGVFTLRDLAACNAIHGGQAVLLTCDSGSGDVQSPNQALHAAGAANLAGFPEVVAATLPVRDSGAAMVVDVLYRALDGAPTKVETVAPEALDRAVLSLRLGPATATDPLSWAPFAHFAWKSRQRSLGAQPRRLSLLDGGETRTVVLSLPDPRTTLACQAMIGQNTRGRFG